MYNVNRLKLLIMKKKDGTDMLQLFMSKMKTALSEMNADLENELKMSLKFKESTTPFNDIYQAETKTVRQCLKMIDLDDKMAKDSIIDDHYPFKNENYFKLTLAAIVRLNIAACQQCTR